MKLENTEGYSFMVTEFREQNDLPEDYKVTRNDLKKMEKLMAIEGSGVTGEHLKLVPNLIYLDTSNNPDITDQDLKLVPKVKCLTPADENCGIKGSGLQFLPDLLGLDIHRNPNFTNEHLKLVPRLIHLNAAGENMQVTREIMPELPHLLGIMHSANPNMGRMDFVEMTLAKRDGFKGCIMDESNAIAVMDDMWQGKGMWEAHTVYRHMYDTWHYASFPKICGEEFNSLRIAAEEGEATNTIDQAMYDTMLGITVSEAL